MSSRATHRSHRISPVGILWFALLLFILTGCSSEPTPAQVMPTPRLGSVPLGATPAETAASPNAEATPLPGRPSGTAGPSTGNGLWLGRGQMSETAIELLWSELDGTQTYELHRFIRSSLDNPENAEPSEASLISSQAGTGYVDQSVEPGSRYWYVLQVEAADGTVQQRWTQADAVTDNTAPPQVTGLVANRTTDSIELSWDEGSDNYMFERYAVRRSHNGKPSIYYGTGFTINQTSFLDDQLPDDGTVTYEVIAVDFHDNLAPAAIITLDLA